MKNVNKKMYQKEYKQLHKVNLLDNPIVSGTLIFILTFTDFYVVENALEQIFYSANPLFLYLTAAIFAIGLDISVYHLGTQVHQLSEIFTNKTALLDLSIFIGSYLAYILLKLGVILAEDMDIQTVLGNIALILVPLLTSILSLNLSLKSEKQEKESVIHTLEIDNIDLMNYLNSLKIQLFELESQSNISLADYDDREFISKEDLILNNTKYLKNLSEFAIARKCNTQEAVDYLTREGDVEDEKGNINDAHS